MGFAVALAAVGLLDELGKSDLHGTGVRLQALCAGEGGNRRRQFQQGVGRKLLNSDDLDKVSGGQSAAQTRRTGSGQHVAGACGIVAGGLWRILTQEHGTGMADLR